MREVPALQAAQAAGVSVVAISVPTELAAAQAWMRRYKLTARGAMAHDHQIWRQLGLSGLPSFVLVDHGRIVGRGGLVEPEKLLARTRRLGR